MRRINKLLAIILTLTLSFSMISFSDFKVRAADSIRVVPFSSALHYDDASNWLYDGVGDDKAVDVFIVAPTVDTLNKTNSVMTEKYKQRFRNAMNQQQALFAYTAKLYAPYYRQAAMAAYSYDVNTREAILENAYIDVSAAFKFYLKHKNNGRPVILAGYSQGADMCYRLLEEYYCGSENEAKELRDNLVAVYAIGGTLTKEFVTAHPDIKPAQEETDTGVVISFDCEDGTVTDSFITPAGTRAISINPLNWKTDSTKASKSLNKGSVTQDSRTGAITSCTPKMCGAYIDPNRGTLIVTDINSEDYPSVLSVLPQGSFHLYDNTLFFVNIQENVQKRTDAFLNQKN